MSRKGFRHKYELSSLHPQEYEAAVFAYLQAGWVEIEVLPETGDPKYIVFEWQKDGPPQFPQVNWP